MAGQTQTEDLVKRFSDICGRTDGRGEVCWQFAPAIGLAWRSPTGPGTNTFLYQEIRSRLVRRQDLLSRVPAYGTGWLGRLAGRTLRTVDVTGPELGGQDCLLILGRTRSKVLDYQNMTATAIELPGYSTIAQEQFAREECGESTTTELLEVRHSDGVFVERLEEGFNLAAFGVPHRFTREVSSVLGRWRANRVRSVPVEEHILGIESDIGDLSSSDHWLRLRRRLPASGRVTIELSHGDLQPANLIATNGGLKLLDFEHLGWRVSGYDLSTYTLGLRWSQPEMEQLSPWTAVEEYRFRSLNDKHTRRTHRDGVGNDRRETDAIGE